MEKFFKNSYEWVLGWRYTRSSRGAHKNKLISFISGLSILAITLSVMSLIVVLSVINGFQTDVRGTMLSVIPHVQVYPSQATLAQPDWETRLTQKIKENPEVLGVSPDYSSQAVVLNDSELLPAKVEGINPVTESEVSNVPNKMVAGHLTDLKDGENDYDVVIGTELAKQLGMYVGNGQYELGHSITLMSTEANATVAGLLPRMREFKVVGVFFSKNFEIDKGYIYMHVNVAKKMFLNGSSALRVKLANMDKAPEVAHQIELSSVLPVTAEDWSAINPSWFSALKTEKVMIAIILLMITLVAIFNLVSMLSMTVNEKLADIAILRTLGASRRSITKIFMIQGALIGGLGTFFGVFFGVLIAYNVGRIVSTLESLLHTDILPKGGVYVLSYMPSEVRWTEVGTIAAITFGLSLLATIYPSRRAAAVEPARALRYE